MAQFVLFPRNHGNMSGKIMYGPQRRPIIKKNGMPHKGKITLREDLVAEQVSLDQRLAEYAIFDVELEGYTKHAIRVPAEICQDGKQFAPYVNNRLPVGFEIDDENRMAFNAIMALSCAKEFYPTYETDFSRTPEGLSYRGQVIATNTDATIIGASRTPFNEIVYRMRANGRYFDLMDEELLTGGWSYKAGPKVRIDDSVQTYIELKREFKGRSEVELKRFQIEELEARKAELQGQIDAKAGGAR